MDIFKSLKNEHDWAAYREKAFQDGYRGRASSDQDAGKGLVKTYLLEAHQDRDELPPDDLEALVKTAFGSAFDKYWQRDVRQIGHRFFSIFLDDGKGFILDCREPRYWRLETTALSRFSDAGCKLLLKYNRWLDQLWLPTSMQLAAPRVAEFQTRALSAAFGFLPAKQSDYDKDYDDLEEADDDQDEDERPDAAVVRIRAENLDFWLNQIKATELDKLFSIYKSENRITGEDKKVAFSTVWYTGKVTSWGIWAEPLIEMQRILIAIYSAGIKRVEDQAVSVVSGEVRGSPIAVSIPREGLTPDEFEEAVFSPKTEFSLLKTWQESDSSGGERYWAVDSLSGTPLTLDYQPEAPSQLLVTLEGDSCGNVVPRLLTNIQRLLDARASCRLFEGSAQR